MKRSSLALSVLGVSIFGCLAFSSTASAAASADWGPSTCVVAYDYCVMVSGNTQAYCEAQLEQCEAGGGFSQDLPRAAMPLDQPDSGLRRG